MNEQASEQANERTELNSTSKRQSNTEVKAKAKSDECE